MKIDSVIIKTVIVINGVEYLRRDVDWTDSIKEVQNDGQPFINHQHVLDWIELDKGQYPYEQ